MRSQLPSGSRVADNITVNVQIALEKFVISCHMLERLLARSTFADMLEPVFAVGKSANEIAADPQSCPQPLSVHRHDPRSRRKQPQPPTSAQKRRSRSPLLNTDRGTTSTTSQSSSFQQSQPAPPQLLFAPAQSQDPQPVSHPIYQHQTKTIQPDLSQHQQHQPSQILTPRSSQTEILHMPQVHDLQQPAIPSPSSVPPQGEAATESIVQYINNFELEHFQP